MSKAKPSRDSAAPSRDSVATSRDSAPQSRDRKGAVVAKVIEELPSLVYRVELEKSRQLVLAHAAGSAGGKRNFVRLLPGDRVEVDVSPHDLTRGRILRKI